ncbi:glycoside hydrolase family 2 protein [Athelia psychrophila]|uniref:Beta-mannosidase A n=1 Tax=Athelia psychrophila TaxID=1759441 RepID=A0A167UWN0_9AGAM|nr:glycoside hydrolase family 2 protein [Fibularhizoctonia sp. CBS 109695]
MPGLLLKLTHAALQLAASVHSKHIIDLSGDAWTLTNQQGNVSIPGSVPSYSQLDLFAAGVIGDPLAGDNDVFDNWVGTSNWTYTSHPITGLENNASTYLVFEGIDTFATILFCNTTIATVNNQFRQWIFHVTPILTSCPTPHPVLSLAFTAAPTEAAYLNNPNVSDISCPACIEAAYYYPGREFIRKQQSDFGWDWSPAFAPTGIWQPAYIVQLPSVGDIHVTNSMVDIYRQGQLNNLPPDQTQPWVVNASIDYIGNLPSSATLNATIVDLFGNPLFTGPLVGVTTANGTITGSLTVKGAPKLWWPVGHGAQTLYNMTLEIVSSHTVLVSVPKRVGFRTIVLNQNPISPAQEALGIAPGANWHFEINGNEIFAKGSNMVPPDPFWPRVTRADFQTLFDTAIAGNQNMLRIWASGAYLPDYAYDLADEMGLLLWTEMQFTDATYPTAAPFVENVLAEVTHHVRRLNHHPSLALWCGSNEIELFLEEIGSALGGTTPPALVEVYEGLFLDVLLHAVWDQSRSISYTPSSSTNGWLSLDHSAAVPMVERYENATSGSIYSDTDYYNYDAAPAFNLSTYPVGRFSVEFGFQSQPSYETYAAVLPVSELSFNSSSILARNHHYPINASTIFSTPGSPPPAQNRTDRSLQGMGEMSLAAETWLPSVTKTDPTANFKAQIYATQIFQSEFYRSQIAFYRRGSGLPQRTLGSLYWMLNDIWAAPTWASVEKGGRWKMLHYGTKDIYQPVIIAPYYDAGTGDVQVWVTSDLWSAVNGTAEMRWYNWDGEALGNGTADFHVPVSVGKVNSTKVFDFNINNITFPLTNAVAILNVSVSGGGKAYTHTHRFHSQSLATPEVISNIPNPNITITPSGTNKFVVESKTLAAFVWLDLPAGVTGYFSDNGFWMLPGKKTVSFTVQSDTTAGKWAKAVTVDSLWTLT